MVKPNSKKRSKKSETLEVRISYDTKQKLSFRAESEGRTVSDVVRNLINTYLAQPASGLETSTFGDAAMRFKQFFIQKPKTALAGLTTLLACSFLFIPTASAESFILDVQGEWVEPISEDNGVRTRRFETEIELDFGSTIIMGADGQVPKMNSDGQYTSVNTILVKDGIWIKVRVDQAQVSNGEDGVLISLSLIDKVNKVERLLAAPNITAAYDETASFTPETDGNIYSFKFSPRTKS